MTDLPLRNADAVFANNYQLSGQAPLSQLGEKGQWDVDDFGFVHLSDKQNHYAGAGGNVKPKNVAKAAVEG